MTHEGLELQTAHTGGGRLHHLAMALVGVGGGGGGLLEDGLDLDHTAVNSIAQAL